MHASIIFKVHVRAVDPDLGMWQRYVEHKLPGGELRSYYIFNTEIVFEVAYGGQHHEVVKNLGDAYREAEALDTSRRPLF